MTIKHLASLAGYILLLALMVAALVYGVDPETHPTCQTKMPAIHAKVRWAQPLTEDEAKWYRDCPK